MSSVIVYIGEAAFISILVSAIESFPSNYQYGRKPPGTTPEGEVFGLLFGQKISRGGSTVFNVTVAAVLQMMREKNPNGFWALEQHTELVETIVQAYPWLQFLGSFHSHSWPKEDFAPCSAEFSDSDREGACAMANEYGDEILETIIALTYLDKKASKESVRDWPSSTNYCGNYKYVLTSYVTNRNAGELKGVDNLICPVAAAVGNYDLIADLP